RPRHPREYASLSLSSRLPFPVLRTAEVVVEPLLVLAGQRRTRIELGGGFDVALREVNVDLGVLPAHFLDPLRRDQHAPAGQPVPRVDDDVADGPRLVVDQEVLDVAEVAVGGADVVAHHVAGAPDIRIAPPPLAAQTLLLHRTRPR